MQQYDPRTVAVPADAFQKLSGKLLPLYWKSCLNMQTACRQQNPYPAQNICHFVHTHVGADSQKQYWEIKQKYRDVILFFKIGTFYELYEDDAQIGHDTLGWKMTITGVGHCRQVMLALNDMLSFGTLVHFAVVSLQRKQTMQLMLLIRCNSQRGKWGGVVVLIFSRHAGGHCSILAHACHCPCTNTCDLTVLISCQRRVPGSTTVMWKSVDM
jgi:hypothetical protein